MISAIRNLVRKNLFFRKLVGYQIASSGLLDPFFKSYKVSPFWQERINNVLNSVDNDYIPRVADAGQIRSGQQVMHNGLKIYLGSYYGPEYTKMLLLSRGVHEPQEERVFAEALKTLPPNAVMIEMGAFWSFYSMWFNKEIKGAINFMVEPDEFNLGQGKRNFQLNKMKGTFIKSFVGKQSASTAEGKTLCIDDLVAEQSLNFIHMLHSDIQGFEFDMLNGSRKTFDANKIGYVFISTHTNEVHYQCLDFLKERGFIILASADLDETYSEDGLIAARAKDFPGIEPVNISKRTLK